MRDEQVFIIIYAVLSAYFAGVMVRLMLVITPVVCVTAAIAFSKLLEAYIDPVIPPTDTAATKEVSASSSKKAAKKVANTPRPKSLASMLGGGGKTGIFALDARIAIISSLTFFLFLFVYHCTYVTQSAYSSPSVVLSSRNQDGSQNIIDDFREAYYWLRQNTEKDAVVMSWWDYGYQIAGMADRPTLVDNNTWNNTHIATVGKAMSSNEDVAYPILRKHDVDYVLVIFGGLIGYSG